MPQKTQIESEEEFLENDVYRLLYDTIKPLAKEKGVSINQLVKTTGLPIFKVEMALKDFMGFYPTRLQVNQEGELIYYFKLGKKLPTESLGKQLWSKLKLVAEFSFKLWVTLMVYVMGIAYGGVLAIIGLTSDPRIFLGALGLLVLCLGVLITDIFKFLFGRKDSTILQIIFRIILGPKEDYEQQLAEEKKILAWIHQNQYKITTVDLVLITGWSLEKSEEELTNLLINYQGEVYVSPEGVIIYHFPKLNSLSTAAATIQFDPIRVQQQFIWNENNSLRWHPTESLAKTIFFIIWVNLFVALVTTILSDYRVQGFWGIENITSFYVHLSFWTTYFLLAFSFITILINRLKKHSFLQRNKNLAEIRVKNKLLKQVFLYVNNFRTKGITGPDEKIFDQIRFDLEGLTDTNNLGEIVVKYDRIEQELKVIQRERGEAAKDWLKIWQQEEIRIIRYSKPKALLPSIEESILKDKHYRFYGIKKAQRIVNKNLQSILLLLVLVVGGVIGGKHLEKEYLGASFLAYEAQLAQAATLSRLELSDIRTAKTAKYMEATLQQFEQLEYLAIRNNYLDALPKGLAQLQNLDTLIIENNKLREIPANALNLPNLRHLEIHEDFFGNAFPKNMQQLPKLNSLSLKDVEDPSNLLLASPNITYLKLEGLTVDTFPTAQMPVFKNLVELDLSNGYIYVLSPDIQNFKQLQRLTITKSKRIHKLPMELGLLTQLKILGMGSVQLEANSTLEALAPIFQLQQLKSLNVSGATVKLPNDHRKQYLSSDDYKAMILARLPNVQFYTE